MPQQDDKLEQEVVRGIDANHLVKANILFISGISRKIFICC